MMKEVLQSNLSLRQQLQAHNDTIDSLNIEMFQMSNENEDLRDRLQVLEDLTGKDSSYDIQKLVKDKKILENRVKQLEQTNHNWNQLQATRKNFY